MPQMVETAIDRTIVMHNIQRRYNMGGEQIYALRGIDLAISDELL